MSTPGGRTAAWRMDMPPLAIPFIFRGRQSTVGLPRSLFGEGDA